MKNSVAYYRYFRNKPKKAYRSFPLVVFNQITERDVLTACNLALKSIAKAKKRKRPALREDGGRE